MGIKKIKGRKRFITVDTLGNLLHVNVCSASTHDSIQGQTVCYQTFRRYSSIRTFSADAGFRGSTCEFVTHILKINIDIPIKNPNQFTILKKRWIVERSFAWLGNFRRLAKDFEFLISVSENFIRIAMISIVLNKL